MLNFLGIGAQKCGTTWLYQALAGHPNVAFPGGKEVHFWNRAGERDLDWYRGLFADDSRCNGEITPAYGFLPLERIREIQAMQPGLRLIYLIRDPAERAWSAARMALQRAEMEHDEASDQWFIDHFHSRGSQARGDYETCIRRWRAVFGAEALLILRFERLCDDPVGVVNRCLDHLGVAGRRFDESERARLRAPQFAGDGVALRPSLRAALQGLYAERVASLAGYLGEDLSGWLREDR